MELKVIELNENGTVYIPYEGMLTEVILSKIIYCPSDNGYVLKEIVVEHQGCEIIVAEDDVYYSIKDYTEGNSIKFTSKFFHLKKGYYWNENTNQPEFYSVTNEGCDLVYDYKTKELIIDGYVPEDLFEIAEDVRLYYPIQVRNIEGEIEEHGGVLSKLMLNEEEMELVEVFKKCLRKMQEHNISFVRVDDKSYVFKSDNIKHYGCWNDCKHNVTFLNKFRVKELEWDKGVDKGEWCDGLSVEFNN